jgi:hypothetical protein
MINVSTKAFMSRQGNFFIDTAIDPIHMGSSIWAVHMHRRQRICIWEAVHMHMGGSAYAYGRHRRQRALGRRYTNTIKLMIVPK